MLFGFGFNNKTVKELRMQRGYTVRELAEKLKISASIISKVDDHKVKHVPEPLKSRLIPVLRGDEDSKVPW